MALLPASLLAREVSDRSGNLPAFCVGNPSLSISAVLDRFSNEPLEILREERMKFLCAVFVDEKKLESLSRTESQALDDESLAYDQTLREKGHFLAAQALESVRTAVTIRSTKDGPLVTDGPFAETREQIGGFILVEAKDMKEAIQIASKIPPMRLGGIEVRPIKELISSKDRQRRSEEGS
jgi:hypothetical protein